MEGGVGEGIIKAMGEQENSRLKVLRAADKVALAEMHSEHTFRMRAVFNGDTAPPLFALDPLGRKTPVEIFDEISGEGTQYYRFDADGLVYPERSIDGGIREILNFLGKAEEAKLGNLATINWGVMIDSLKRQEKAIESCYKQEEAFSAVGVAPETALQEIMTNINNIDDSLAALSKIEEDFIAPLEGSFTDHAARIAVYLSQYQDSTTDSSFDVDLSIFKFDSREISQNVDTLFENEFDAEIVLLELSQYLVGEIRERERQLEERDSDENLKILGQEKDQKIAEIGFYEGLLSDLVFLKEEVCGGEFKDGIPELGVALKSSAARFNNRIALSQRLRKMRNELLSLKQSWQVRHELAMKQKESDATLGIYAETLLKRMSPEGNRLPTEREFVEYITRKIYNTVHRDNREEVGWSDITFPFGDGDSWNPIQLFYYLADFCESKEHEKYLDPFVKHVFPAAAMYLGSREYLMIWYRHYQNVEGIKEEFDKRGRPNRERRPTDIWEAAHKILDEYSGDIAFIDRFRSVKSLYTELFEIHLTQDGLNKSRQDFLDLYKPRTERRDQRSDIDPEILKICAEEYFKRKGLLDEREGLTEEQKVFYAKIVTLMSQDQLKLFLTEDQAAFLLRNMDPLSPWELLSEDTQMQGRTVLQLSAAVGFVTEGEAFEKEEGQYVDKDAAKRRLYANIINSDEGTGLTVKRMGRANSFYWNGVLLEQCKNNPEIVLAERDKGETEASIKTVNMVVYQDANGEYYVLDAKTNVDDLPAGWKPVYLTESGEWVAESSGNEQLTLHAVLERMIDTGKRAEAPAFDQAGANYDLASADVYLKSFQPYTKRFLHRWLHTMRYIQKNYADEKRYHWDILFKGLLKSWERMVKVQYKGKVMTLAQVYADPSIDLKDPNEFEVIWGSYVQMGENVAPADRLQRAEKMHKMMEAYDEVLGMALKMFDPDKKEDWTPQKVQDFYRIMAKANYYFVDMFTFEECMSILRGHSGIPNNLTASLDAIQAIYDEGKKDEAKGALIRYLNRETTVGVLTEGILAAVEKNEELATYLSGLGANFDLETEVLGPQSQLVFKMNTLAPQTTDDLVAFSRSWLQLPLESNPIRDEGTTNQNWLRHTKEYVNSMRMLQGISWKDAPASIQRYQGVVEELTTKGGLNKDLTWKENEFEQLLLAKPEGSSATDKESRIQAISDKIDKLSAKYKAGSQGNIESLLTNRSALETKSRSLGIQKQELIEKRLGKQRRFEQIKEDSSTSEEEKEKLNAEILDLSSKIEALKNELVKIEQEKASIEAAIKALPADIKDNNLIGIFQELRFWRSIKFLQEVRLEVEEKRLGMHDIVFDGEISLVSGTADRRLTLCLLGAYKGYVMRQAIINVAEAISTQKNTLEMVTPAQHVLTPASGDVLSFIFNHLQHASA